MSLDNIQLPPAVVQGLYNKSLYDLNPDKSEVNPTETSGISFLGDNVKKVAILITSAKAIYLPDEELNFLLGILNACRLSMADVALINTDKNSSISYKDLAEQLSAEKIFLFGTDPGLLGLPIQFPHYQIQHFYNQVYLSSVSLNELQTDKEEKLKLWNCLKKIFLQG